MSTDPCPTCGAAMAADQRYCLACGNRRAEARLDYLEILRGRPFATAAGTGAPVVAPVSDARVRDNTTIIASIGCLLLAMGVGVLIGNSGNGTKAAPAASAAPQVIKVEGGGAAATATPSARPSTKKAKASKRKSSSSAVETAKSAADSKATNPQLKNLDSTSGDDYAKQAQKLPKQVSTGGKAPPIDKSKPAGGGTGFEDIG